LLKNDVVVKAFRVAVLHREGIDWGANAEAKSKPVFVPLDDADSFRNM
jgi:hypothetical protein